MQKWRRQAAEAKLLHGGGGAPAVEAARAGHGLSLRVVRAGNGAWCRCRLTCSLSSIGGGLSVFGADAGIIGGMSGSPIFAEDGAAIGVVSTSSGTEGGPNPYLTYHLPGWLLAKLYGRTREHVTANAFVCG
jgi:hypothetical protein